MFLFRSVLECQDTLLSIAAPIGSRRGDVIKHLRWGLAGTGELSTTPDLRIRVPLEPGCKGLVIRSRRDGSVERYLNFNTGNYVERTTRLKMSNIVANSLHTQPTQGVVFVTQGSMYEVLDSHGFAPLNLCPGSRSVIEGCLPLINRSGFVHGSHFHFFDSSGKKIYINILMLGVFFFLGGGVTYLCVFFLGFLSKS